MTVRAAILEGHGRGSALTRLRLRYSAGQYNKGWPVSRGNSSYGPSRFQLTLAAKVVVGARNGGVFLGNTRTVARNACRFASKNATLARNALSFLQNAPTFLKNEATLATKKPALLRNIETFLRNI